ncbi:MAG: PilZ domain-containing protein [Acidobacteriota bacterium]
MERRRNKKKMLQADRRMGNERRAATRYKVSLDVEWEGEWGRRSGTISDLSELGCFVLSSGDAADGSLVTLFLPLSAGMKVQFVGEVTNHLVEVGFAARFLDLTYAQKEFLSNLIEMYKEE